MKRFKLLHCLYVLAVGMTLPSGRADARTVGIAVTSGYQTYSLSRLNETIVAPSLLLPGASPDVEGGTRIGVGLRLQASDPWIVALDLFRLSVSDRGKGTLSGTPYDWKLDLPSSAATLQLTYFPMAGPLKAGLALGGGYYAARGSVETVATGSSSNVDIRGDGFGTHALVEGELTLSKGLSAELGVGYRWAKTSHVDFSRALGPSGDSRYPSHIDWSGLMTHLGLVWYFRK